MITVVTGLPRSGTSLMMRMLHVGGLEVAADNFCSYEIDSFWDASPESMASYAEGKVIKWLEPLVQPLPNGHDYNFIWMRRDFSKQAKSHFAMMEAIGVGLLHNDYSKLEASLENDTKESVKLLEKIGKVKVVEYQDLLNNPLQAIREVSEFLGKKLLCLSASQEVLRKKDENEFLELRFASKRIQEQENAVSRGFKTFEAWSKWGY